MRSLDRVTTRRAPRGTLALVRGVLALVAVIVVALLAAGAAEASFIVDRNASAVTLRISSGTAIVNYTAAGVRRHALLSGAVNARTPNPSMPQVRFHAVYGSGSAAGGTCRAYTGEALPFLVAACDGADGSHWALQSWNRLQPNFGGTSAPWELQASHWTGDAPKIEAWVDWQYGYVPHVFGRYTFHGQPVYGFHSTRYGSPRDTYGRNVYLDTYGSAYGSGWRRENSFLAHKGTGVFCYGFFQHGGRSGAGKAYRLTAQGPGVAPIVQWTGNAPGPYDPDTEAQLKQLERSLGDRLCRNG